MARSRPIPYWHFDAGAAMLILLAAIDEGYAASSFGVFMKTKPFKELLHIPDGRRHVHHHRQVADDSN